MSHVDEAMSAPTLSQTGSREGKKMRNHKKLFDARRAKSRYVSGSRFELCDTLLNREQ